MVFNTEAVSAVPEPMPQTEDTGGNGNTGWTGNTGGNGNRRALPERYGKIGGGIGSGFGSGSGRYRENRQVQCYSCQKFGHYASECRDRTNKTCHYCGKVGHLISRCFKKRNDERYSRNSPQNSHQNFRQGPGNQLA